MVNLPNVTVIAIACNRQAETIAALYKTMAQIKPAAVKLLTDIDISATGIEVIKIDKLDWEGYNRFCIKELWKHFDTSHVLLVQWDGYVLDCTCWSDEFLEYDYIGAKWLDIGKPYNVGNGGFSIRSKKLQTILATDAMINVTCPEDVAICKVYGQYLMDNYGIKYANEYVADKFAFELNQPTQKTFGFHGFHWAKFKETIVVRRSHALGDVLRIEPLLYYFHKKGYQVSLDTDPYFMSFFTQHWYPIIPFHNLNPNLPYRLIDLNAAYEVKPKQLHLESYYDFAEVPKEERIIRNPILSLAFNPKNKENKLFEKYCVLHIDKRNEPHRNIEGINWRQIVVRLNELGYTVVQIGLGEHEKVQGAIQMKTPTSLFLSWLIGGADLFIGIDSGLAHVASGFGIPSIVFFGSVNPDYIYADQSNMVAIHNHKIQICSRPFCWHDEVGGTTGKTCYVNAETPPCVQFNNIQLLSAIDKLLNIQNEQNRINQTSNY